MHFIKQCCKYQKQYYNSNLNNVKAGPRDLPWALGRKGKLLLAIFHVNFQFM